MPAREYDNTLRRQQADATRLRILTAVRDLLADGSMTLQVPEIAARAGVSEPTVYRHFPNRDALLDAAAESVAEHLGAPPEPADADDLPIVAIAVARYFEANAPWIRAALAEPALRPLRAGGRKRRVERRQRLVAPAVVHLEPREREIATAAFNMVCRVDNWDCLTREFGLTSEEAGCAVSWILRSMLDAAARDKQRRRRQLVDEQTLERGRQWRRDASTERRSE